MNDFKRNLSAGLVVSLVALPIGLGTALASGAPMISGILAAVVGGVVVGALSQSKFSVSGPTASLVVFVAASVQELGSWEAFLPAIFISGLFQVALGYLGAGFVSGLFPSLVIKGMLSAIGLILVFKQIPHALGRDLDFEGDFAFWGLGGENTFSGILNAFLNLQPGALIVSFVTFAILLSWARPWVRSVSYFRYFRYLPGPLVAVVAGTLVNELLLAGNWGWGLEAEQGHLVSIPDNFLELTAGIRGLDWRSFDNSSIWKIGLVLTLFSSLETLLSIEALEKLDSKHRVVSRNRELVAQGVGNVLASLLGALPLSAVLVRGTTNFYAGASSRWAAILHGIFIALAVLIFPKFLNHVPLACVAVVLMTIGMRLIRPQVMLSLFRLGWDQFLPYCVTVLGILFSDLLSGVALGLVVSIALILRSSLYSAIAVASEGSDYLILFIRDISFFHRVRLQKELAKIPEDSVVLIDGTRASFIDRDISELLDDFVEAAAFKRIQVSLRNVKNKQFPRALRLGNLVTGGEK